MTNLTPYILIFSPLIAFFVWSWISYWNYDAWNPRGDYRLASISLLVAALIITGITMFV